MVRQDGTTLRETSLRRGEERDRPREVKWRPKRELWDGGVADDNPAFGKLHPGNEVQVLSEKSKHPQIRSVKEWVAGVVIAVDDKRQRVAVSLASAVGTVEVRRGFGFMRRAEDSRELLHEDQVEEIARLRYHGNAGALAAYAESALRGSVPAASHAVVALCRMGAAELARQLVQDKGLAVHSVARRELAHALALDGRVGAALAFLGGLRQPSAAQLLVEVLALALTGRIQAERARLDVKFLQGVEENEVVKKAAADVKWALQLLESYATAVQMQPPLASREGLTEAFNELLQSCGRAHEVPLAFRVLEWMERMVVPKNNYTYEAIGLNVVKRVALIRKVWDLPTAPEETVPEVVFAGRSNVGKSSLVNMLVGRNALAPTSSKPGKTRTMDFFAVNASHPALPQFRLVDVPGLGFARASKDMRKRWVSLIGGYFVQRRSLRVVFHLLDASLCEILPADRDLWKLLAQARRQDFELCIALTKADNTFPSQLERFARIVRQALREEGSELAMHATIFACSARSKLGKDSLWRKIWSAVGEDGTRPLPGLAPLAGRAPAHDDLGRGELEDDDEELLAEAREPRLLEVPA